MAKDCGLLMNIAMCGRQGTSYRTATPAMTIRLPAGSFATPTGLGYYIVMADGGVHARGDAAFYGSTGGSRPGGHDVTGIALSYDLRGNVNGYWLVADDGG